uniref:Uncharacterized protein n=1 Tax=Panagrellus redivivus TaxID=6233 RepID=A0A7E4ZX51_PANRE
MLYLIFYTFVFAHVIHAKDSSFTDVVDKYAKTCIDKTPVDGRMTILYRSVKLYDEFPPFNVKSFDAKSELQRNPRKASDVLLKTACICADIKINGYEFIVVPFMVNGLAEDALTLCVFHDSMTTFPVVLDIPPFGFGHWMIAQYIARMPRSVAAPPSDASSIRCIDAKGHPTATIPGQKACYYWSFAKFVKNKDDIGVAEHAYSGPFLGSQLPDFNDLASFSETGSTSADFATLFDYVTCSLLKTQSRLTSDEFQTGCRYRGFYDSALNKLAMVFCCCDGPDDPNCRNVNEAIKEQKIVCLKGSIDSETSFYFAKECPYTSVKKFDRILPKDEASEHRYALELTRPDVMFNSLSECNSTTVTSCHELSVDIAESGCCSGSNFCSLYRALSNLIPRCKRYYGENQKIEGCSVVFYRAGDQWHQASTVWILLYTARLPGTDLTYSVSFGFMAEKRVESNCNESLKPRDYYVINCPARFCDYRFYKYFFRNLKEKDITDALQKVSIPRCENGSFSLTTANAQLDQLQFTPETTRVFGQYCILRLNIVVNADNTVTISIQIGPVFPYPQDCGTYYSKDDGGFNYTCCYSASANLSHIDANCHYSNVMSIVNALNTEVVEEDELSTNITQDSVELVMPNTGRRVYEYADHCGHGCFHLNGLNDAKESVVASCIGRAEQLIVTREDAFERFHEALICLTEEVQNTCHLVNSGTQQKYLCCCQSKDIKNNVARYATRACDFDFDDAFFNFFHESIINYAINQAASPRCETGSMKFTTDATVIDELPRLTVVTRIIGVCCSLKSQISVVRNKNIINHVDLICGNGYRNVCVGRAEKYMTSREG